MTPKNSLYTPDWDYTHQAACYHLRPNYADAAIDALCEKVNAGSRADYVIADVGAGTGNLTVMFSARGLRCLAVEPNAAMRHIGIERTQGLPVEWIVGSGEHTTLPSTSVDLF